MRNVTAHRLVWGLLLVAGGLAAGACGAQAEDLRVLRGRYVVALPELTVSALDAPISDDEYVGQPLGNPNTLLFNIGVGSSSTPVEIPYNATRATQDCQTILATLPNGASCSPDYVVHASVVSNDTLSPGLWGMSGTQGIDAPRAWEISTGSRDVVVAVIDTGVDYTHSDLKANMWTNPGEIPGNNRDDDGNGYVDDVYGYDFANRDADPFDDNNHGTHVAGTIGAVGNNSLGVVGVNWNVKIMPLKFLSASGSGSISGAIQALNYIAMMRRRGVNVRVANNSWGGGGFSKALLEAIRTLNDQDVLFVAAAGNEANDNDASPSYPASYDVANVLSVAAIDSQGNLASFSNYGAHSVHVGAPGVDILSTLPGGRYGSYSGTSMATPHVSGAAALLLAAQGDLSAKDLKAALVDKSRLLPSLSGVTTSGRALDIGRVFLGDPDGEPEPTPAPEPNCTYSVDSGFSLTPPDGGTTLLASDEGTVTVALTYPILFYGKTITEIQISANGVVYMSPTTDVVLDYEPGATAPSESIAAFHTDLNTTAGSVRMIEDADATWIVWQGSHYYDPNLTMLAVVKISATGVIELQAKGQSGVLSKVITENTTIGIRKKTVESAITYSAGSSLIRDGVSVRFAPVCDGAAAGPTVSTVRLRGAGAKKQVKPGARFGIVIAGDGSGLVPAELRVKSAGGWCSAYTQVNLVGGRATLQGSVPKGARIQQITVYAGMSVDTLRINLAKQIQSKKARLQSVVCDAVLAGLSAK